MTNSKTIANPNANSKLESLFKVGKIKDAHGLKGQLYFLAFAKELDWYQESMEITLEMPALKLVTEGSQEANLPIKSYRVTYLKEFKDGAIIQLEGISDRTAAEKLKGSLVYIENENLISESGETIFLNEILGFEVHKENGELAGRILNFSSNGIQDLLVIEKDSFQYEVPFVEEFIIEILFDEKIIKLDFPDELMDINREV